MWDVRYNLNDDSENDQINQQPDFYNQRSYQQPSQQPSENYNRFQQAGYETPQQDYNHGSYYEPDYDQHQSYYDGADPSYQAVNRRESMPGVCAAGMDTASWLGVAAGATAATAACPPLAPITGVVAAVSTIAAWFHRATHNYRDDQGNVVQHDGNGNRVHKPDPYKGINDRLTNLINSGRK